LINGKESLIVKESKMNHRDTTRDNDRSATAEKEEAILREAYQHGQQKHGFKDHEEEVVAGLRAKIRNVRSPQIRGVNKNGNYETPSVEGQTSATAPRNNQEVMGVGRGGASEQNLPGEMSRASEARVREGGVSTIRVSRPGVSESGCILKKSRGD
jgi:hypothetical protein